VAGTARQDDVLGDAAVVVCGAGHGMLAKALLAGVPVVTVPGGGDQWELANRVSRAGAGVIVRPASPGAIAAAVKQILDDPSYTANARRIGAGVTATADPVPIVRRILEKAPLTCV
jgi:UDP:flavonoid glycosyltransferase YjiC (YdhE family)